jgi:hypothetical protein
LGGFDTEVADAGVSDGASAADHLADRGNCSFAKSKARAAIAGVPNSDATKPVGGRGTRS